MGVSECGSLFVCLCVCVCGTKGSKRAAQREDKDLVGFGRYGTGAEDSNEVYIQELIALSERPNVWGPSEKTTSEVRERSVLAALAG